MSKNTEKIHHSNWMTSYYKNQNLKAFISLVADLHPSNPELVVTHYGLTMTNTDGEELFQELFLDIDQALNELNERYDDWKLIEMAKTLSDGDGCSSCAAH
ncbi:MAG: hypothetical protein L6Q33_10440 [Bacteriovoracaceae bacterium]|jgi:hypothetical protein|nr:hypothetical protein [Bacteriovoracaceae bacterium]